MVQITGNYQHEKNENIDEYFRAIGVPYIGRKMMAASSPSMEITEENGNWKIKTLSLFRTVEINFKLDQEYEENMLGGLLKTVTSFDNGKLMSISTALDGTKIKRIYEFNNTQCIINLLHERSGQTAKRIFRRLEN